jgi:hypothetical protein
MPPLSLLDALIHHAGRLPREVDPDRIQEAALELAIEQLDWWLLRPELSRAERARVAGLLEDLHAERSLLHARWAAHSGA